MAELDEISRVQGIKWWVHGVQTLFFRVLQAALGTYIGFIAHNTRVHGLHFGVHVELLQIFLSVQLPRSADWPPPTPLFQKLAPEIQIKIESATALLLSDLMSIRIENSSLSKLVKRAWPCKLFVVTPLTTPLIPSIFQFWLCHR